MRSPTNNNFARPDVFFESGISYYPVGEVDNYEALIVNVSINSSIAGNYTIHSNLQKRIQQSDGWDEWYHVAWNMSERITYVEGVNTNTSTNVSIRFEGSEIYGSEQTSPFRVNFNLHRVMDEWGWEEWINNYDPEVLFLIIIIS